MIRYPGSGSLLLVDFWASWCGPCRKTLPALDRLSRQYGPPDLKVLGVALDAEPEAVGRFLEGTPLGFQILRDPAGVLARDFQVACIPTAVLLDQDGQELARFEGGGRIPADEAAIAALEPGRCRPAPAGAGGGRKTSPRQVPGPSGRPGPVRVAGQDGAARQR